MSYDLYLGGRRNLFYGSPTYNYGSMIRWADKKAGGTGCSFAAIHKQWASKAKIWFHLILVTLKNFPAEARKHEPANKWGTYESLIECFESYVKASDEHPHATWRQIGDGDDPLLCSAGWVSRP